SARRRADGRARGTDAPGREAVSQRGRADDDRADGDDRLQRELPRRGPGEEHSKGRERQAARAAAFLKSQLDAVKQEVDLQERRAGEFKDHHTAELPQQLEANLSALDRFSTRLRLNGEYQLRALERRDRLDRELRTAPAKPTAGGEDGQEPSGPARLEK